MPLFGADSQENLHLSGTIPQQWSANDLFQRTEVEYNFHSIFCSKASNLGTPHRLQVLYLLPKVQCVRFRRFSFLNPYCLERRGLEHTTSQMPPAPPSNGHEGQKDGTWEWYGRGCDCRRSYRRVLAWCERLGRTVLSIKGAGKHRRIKRYRFDGWVLIAFPKRRSISRRLVQEQGGVKGTTAVSVKR